MKKGVDEQLMNNKLLWMGFRDSIQGTEMLRIAIKLWEPGISITKEIYPTVAKACGSTPSRVERCMRHAIESAWDRGDYVTINSVFGGTVKADKGTPTVGDFIARMAVFCAYAD